MARYEEGPKRIELNYCMACHGLDNCRKNLGRQPTRVCKAGRCRLFEKCVDKDRFSTLQKALDFFQKHQTERYRYDIHISLTCNKCRAEEKDRV